MVQTLDGDVDDENCSMKTVQIFIHKIYWMITIKKHSIIWLALYIKKEKQVKWFWFWYFFFKCKKLKKRTKSFLSKINYKQKFDKFFFFKIKLKLQKSCIHEFFHFISELIARIRISFRSIRRPEKCSFLFRVLFNTPTK